MSNTSYSTAEAKAESSWRNALLFGNKEYFDKLAEELQALNDFGAATGTGAIGSCVIAETFKRQRLSPIDAGLMINHPSYDLFLGDALFVLGASSAVLGHDTSVPAVTLPAGEDDVLDAAVRSMEHVIALGKKASAPQERLQDMDMPEGEEVLADSFKDDKGREWTALDVIEEFIYDTSERVFKRPDLANSLRVILAQESPRRSVDGYTYVQTNAVGPANGSHPRGLYQFKESAWKEAGTVKLPNGQLVSSVIGGYDNAFDARTNIIASAALIIRNEQIARASSVRMVDHLPKGKALSDPAVAYLMHNQGVGGAKKLLKQGASAVETQLRLESKAARKLISTIFEGV